MCVNVNNYISQPMRFCCLPDCQPQGQIQYSWKEVHVYKGGGGGGGGGFAVLILYHFP